MHTEVKMISIIMQLLLSQFTRRLAIMAQWN